LTNEFCTLGSACSNLALHGPRCKQVQLTNQVCMTIGFVSSQSFIDGTQFILLPYRYSFSNTWMNFSILVGFSACFLIALLVFTKILSPH
ncbi:hypothetical protein L208DRAFT_1262245, partial [Tricholoma matsutake]